MTPMSENEIRLATAGDAGAIEVCTRAAYSKFVDRLGREPEPMTADYARIIADHEVWALDSAGAGVRGLIAALVLIPHPDHLLIYSVAVDPRHQGRGLGHRLLAHAEEEAQRKGLLESRLYTNALMSENVSFYQRLGYHETGRREHPDFEGSVIVFMSKHLNPL